MAKTMQVSLVAADREVWSGEATVVNARPLAGEIGIMADHSPVMSVLASGQVDVRTGDDGHWVAAVDGGFMSVADNHRRLRGEPVDGGQWVAAGDGGFMSVADNHVRLLCEYAELSHESDFDEAKRLLEE